MEARKIFSLRAREGLRKVFGAGFETAQFKRMMEPRHRTISRVALSANHESRCVV